MADAARAYGVIVRPPSVFLVFPNRRSAEIEGGLLLLEGRYDFGLGLGIRFESGIGFEGGIIEERGPGDPGGDRVGLHLMIIGDVAGVDVVVDIDVEGFLGTGAVE